MDASDSITTSGSDRPHLPSFAYFPGHDEHEGVGSISEGELLSSDDDSGSSGDDNNDDNDDEDDNGRATNGTISKVADQSNEPTAEELDYIRFVRSVFNDDDHLSAANSLCDEDDDDEDEYRPEDDISPEDCDLEDLERVAKGEVRELVTECLRTIVDDNNFKRPSKAGNDEIEDDQAPIHATYPREFQIGDIDEDALSDGSMEDSGGDINDDDDDDENNWNNDNGNTISNRVEGEHINRHHRSSSADNMPTDIILPGQNSRTLISTLVNQIFTGGQLSEVHVDGLPVDTIRKLVGRQMSMASQLLLEMLLLSNEKSECFSKCFTCLMELSNQREKAIKKAAFLEMNVEHIRSYHSAKNERSVVKRHRRLQQQKEKNIAGISSIPDMIDKPLTRSALSNLNKMKSKSVAIVDLPLLAKMPELFAMIDAARSNIKSQSSFRSNHSRAPTLAPEVAMEDQLHPGSLASKYQTFTGHGSHYSTAAAINPQENYSKVRMPSFPVSINDAR